MLQLVIGNKNYSSWSMRPWVLLRQLGIPFEERPLRFGDMAPGSPFKQAVQAVSPAGRVPVLLDGELAVWDSLAIVEYVAEHAAVHHPDLAPWPRERAARARARSLCAEIHGGFTALRDACPMNIEAVLPEVGRRVLAERPAVAEDLARIVAMWRDALARSGGPFLFGGFSIADAYYAPVAMRVRSYGLPLPADLQAYADRLWACEGVSAWVQGALAEHDFVAVDEPYRTRP